MTAIATLTTLPTGERPYIDDDMHHRPYELTMDPCEPVGLDTYSLDDTKSGSPRVAGEATIAAPYAEDIATVAPEGLKQRIELARALAVKHRERNNTGWALAFEAIATSLADQL